MQRAASKVVKVPRDVARGAIEAADLLNARGNTAAGPDGPRPFRDTDLIREALAEGFPAVLARRGLTLIQGGAEERPGADGIRKALDTARPLLTEGRTQAEVCDALNVAGLLNTTRREARPWSVDALARALRREGRE